MDGRFDGDWLTKGGRKGMNADAIAGDVGEGGMESTERVGRRRRPAIGSSVGLVPVVGHVAEVGWRSDTWGRSFVQC